MTAAEIDILKEWLERIESKIDCYNDRLTGIEMHQAEMKANMIDKDKMEKLEAQVSFHDIFIRGCLWAGGIIGAAILLGALAASASLLLHGRPITDLLVTVTPFIVTATP